MQDDDLSLRIRPRNPWEAIDLGVSMTRSWWREVYAAWFMLTLPLFVLINWLLQDYPSWALLLLWWLKPLYDRVLLLVYSRKVFGQPADLAAVWLALPDLLFRSGLLLHLTLYRLDPARSLRLPVWQLEGLRGRQRSQRYKVLARRAGGPAAWLTVVGVHLESFLQFAVFGLIWLFIPELVLESVWRQAWNLMSDSNWPYWAYLAQNSIYYLGMSAIEPMYVAGGFGLYLNRRTQLEGWDLEITFRRMAQRLADASSSAVTGLLLATALTLTLATTVLHSPTAQAQTDTTAGQRLPPEQSETVITEVLADKDFGGTRSIKSWTLRDDLSFDAPEETADDHNWSLLGLARAAEVLMWIAFAVALAYLITRIIRYRQALPSRRRAEQAPPEAVSGLDIRPESLPDDVAAEARRLWQDGHYRQALSLAYRGALSALVHHYQVTLTDSATEGDVLLAARPRLPRPEGDFLGLLTGLWQRQAYAHQRPDDAAVLAMLADWDRHFGRGPGGGTGGGQTDSPAGNDGERP